MSTIPGTFVRKTYVALVDGRDLTEHDTRELGEDSVQNLLAGLEREHDVGVRVFDRVEATAELADKKLVFLSPQIGNGQRHLVGQLVNTPHLHWLAEQSGGPSLAALSKLLEELASDETARAIKLRNGRLASIKTTDKVVDQSGAEVTRVLDAPDGWQPGNTFTGPCIRLDLYGNLIRASDVLRPHPDEPAGLVVYLHILDMMRGTPGYKGFPSVDGVMVHHGRGSITFTKPATMTINVRLNSSQLLHLHYDGTQLSVRLEGSV